MSVVIYMIHKKGHSMKSIEHISPFKLLNASANLQNCKEVISYSNKFMRQYLPRYWHPLVVINAQDKTCQRVSSTSYFMYNLLLVWLYAKSDIVSTLKPLSYRYFISLSNKLTSIVEASSQLELLLGLLFL